MRQTKGNVWPKPKEDDAQAFRDMAWQNKVWILERMRLEKEPPGVAISESGLYEPVNLDYGHLVNPDIFVKPKGIVKGLK